MNGNPMLLFPVLLPVLAGLALPLVPAFREKKPRRIYTAAVLGLNLVLFFGMAAGGGGELFLFSLTDALPVFFRTDGLALLFGGLVSVMWLASGIFSFEYMEHEKNHVRYYSFFLISLGVLLGLGFAGNYVTLYLFFELMTLLTMPLALHSGTKEAVAAGIKYVKYSIFGASLGLLGLFFLYHYGTTFTFVPGGVLDMSRVAGHEGMLRIVFFLVVAGFGAKAGMFPLHAWLPTAHPVAPAPASAVLSGVITKAGVLAILRVIYYQVGVEFLFGTWVQTAWLILALITVFMGSMMAYRENVLKKRLAYSTVSQVSYVLFGVFLMNQTAMTGALLHVVCHSVIKDVLFLCAGAIIYQTHKTEVGQLRGIGKEMPVVMWCFTLVSLALIGIPPLCGFISKWYLAMGSLESGISVIAWLGPVILLVSALLTAGYLFSITIAGFFPGADADYTALEKKEPSRFMTVPLVILTAAAVLLGVFPKPLLDFIQTIVSAVL
ncbi:MAG: proton-conducting membrane transporter [Lachnospiraceae bacterium]|nr:proton-conducting membrane transporter [Lachnospiraceae bacterium]